MRTITFYSYKGGVGRSLLVANTAKFLSTIGKKVFALDLDLEAPGLQYKFELGPSSVRTGLASGLLDLLTGFIDRGSLPKSLKNYVSDTKIAADANPICLMRAGTAPSTDYWKQLSRVNWHELFYSPKAEGVPFFLELKERIRAEFSPDYLLIDARTGLTEMSAVATTLLPDVVVCLALASPEHLEGIRELMRGIERTTKREGSPVRLVPVISRYPVKKASKDEVTEIGEITSFLNASGENRDNGLKLEEVITLHSEPLLESEELLLIGSKYGPHDIPLVRDYLRLFSKIISAEDIRPHVGEIVKRAAARLLDDPDGAQLALEALITYCADEEAFRALIQLYRLRKASIDLMVSTAALMWQLTPHEEKPDPLLVEVVRQGYSEGKPGGFQRKHVEFAEAICRLDGMCDYRVATTIANAWLQENRSRGVKVLADYVACSEAPNVAAVIRLIELLRAEGRADEAMDIVSKFKMALATPEFYVAWAKLILDQKDPSAIEKLLADPSFRAVAVRDVEPGVLYRLYRIGGSESPRALLEEALERAIADQNFGVLTDLADIFQDEGRLDEFEMAIDDRMPAGMRDEILMRAKRKRGSKYMGPTDIRRRIYS
jgi:hypothetical protein